MGGAFPRSHNATSTLEMLADDTVGRFEIPDLLDSAGGIFASVLPPERSTDRRLGVNACTPVTRHRVPFFMIKISQKKNNSEFRPSAGSLPAGPGSLPGATCQRRGLAGAVLGVVQ